MNKQNATELQRLQRFIDDMSHHTSDNKELLNYYLSNVQGL